MTRRNTIRGRRKRPHVNYDSGYIGYLYNEAMQKRIDNLQRPISMREWAEEMRDAVGNKRLWMAAFNEADRREKV